MSEEREIPKGWVETTLGEIISISSGKGLVQAKQISDGEYFVYGGNGFVGKHNCYLFEEKQLIIGRVGVHCGNIHVTKAKSWVTDNAFIVTFNSKEIYINYLYWLIKVLNLNKYSSSTAQPVISQGKLYPIEIKIAPLSEQHRIVAKIEELFSSLDKGIESLKTAQAQLKVYRQAVLKWAFEGKLTNKNVKERGLPEGWKVEELKKITVKAKKVKVKEQKPNDEFIYLDIGGIDNSILKIVSHKNYQWKDAPSRAQQIIEVGDTLFSTVRTYLKNIAFVDKEIYHNQIGSSGFTVIRADKNNIEPKYLFFYSTYQGFINPLNKLQTGTSYPAVRDEDVFSQLINYPISLKEQEQIIREIESRLSVCDKIEESISTSLIQAEALRQSILKKAFEGKLVEQDPNDEPAGKLLERIASTKPSTGKAEREALRQGSAKLTLGAQGKNKPEKKVKTKKKENSEWLKRGK